LGKSVERRTSRERSVGKRWDQRPVAWSAVREKKGTWSREILRKQKQSQQMDQKWGGVQENTPNSLLTLRPAICGEGRRGNNKGTVTKKNCKGN